MNSIFTAETPAEIILFFCPMLRSTYTRQYMIHPHATDAQMGQTINPLTVSYCSFPAVMKQIKQESFRSALHAGPNTPTLR